RATRPPPPGSAPPIPSRAEDSKTPPCAPLKGFRPAHPTPPKGAGLTGQIVRYLNRTDRLLPTARFIGLVKNADMGYGCAIEFRPDDLASPRVTRRTDDLLPISIALSRPCDCAAYLNTYLKEVSHDARNRKVVQQPKRLWLHPAG